MIRIGVNGFGRTGRQVIKIIQEGYPEKLDIVAINSLRNPGTLAHLFKYDSTYSRNHSRVESGEHSISIDGKSVKVLAGSKPGEIPWAECGVEMVIEATGRFRDREAAAGHLKSGVKKVIISAPGIAVDTTIVMGVNEDKYDAANHNIISCASCTTNCLAPVAKVLNDNFGIVRGFMSTIHAYTADQAILDRFHNDLRRGRAAAMSIIPTTTGAAQAVTQVMPDLEGKLGGLAFRVPVPIVSAVDFVVDLDKKVGVDEVNDALRSAAAGPLKGILKCCDEPLVSIDFKGNSASAIVDTLSTAVVGESMVKVLAWYDNEWGYSSRMADLAAYIADKGLSNGG